jgi:uncharacterized protein
VTPLRLSTAEARRLLAAYQFTPASTAGVFDRLGCVQFDPLKPVGRNADLALQARVPGYRVDDWETAAYSDRLAYDAWDKMACLVPISDWPYRRHYHSWYRDRWQPTVLGPYEGAAEAILRELREHGPRSSLDFEDQQRVESWAGSWYGPKLAKQVARALWDSGEIVTTRRASGRHVYDLAKRVIPAEFFQAPPVEERTAQEFVMLRRHQSAGLLRASVDGALWNIPGRIAALARSAMLASLVERAALREVTVEGRRYHALPSALEWLDAEPTDAMQFVAPLDTFMWDRLAVEEIFGFEYRWEVYVPEEKRRWGYYVLPVVLRDRIVARFDSRLVTGTWHVYSWQWEPEADRDDAAFAALTGAVSRFRDYLGAKKVTLPRRMDPETRRAFRDGVAPRAQVVVGVIP